MRVEAWRVATAVVPMSRPFRHAAAQRGSTASVLVEIEAGDVVGWGEGAPRQYVTGESLAGAVDQLGRRLDRELLEWMLGRGTFEARVNHVATLAGAPMRRLLNNSGTASSAAAALELALLDTLCRRFERPVRAVLPLLGLSDGTLRDTPQAAPAAYVIDLDQDPADALGALPLETLHALRHVKVKVGPDLVEAAGRAARARRACPRATLAVDVNGAWRPDQVAKILDCMGESGVDWLEEPFSAREWGALRTLVRAGMGVMLDESFRDRADLLLAARFGAATHLNIRISKCGGLISAARLMDEAHRSGLGYQVGVQVGEIGPLWAAGRTLGCQAAHACAVEVGRQDEWFDVPLTTPRFVVDRTRALAHPMAGVGVGVTPSARLRRALRWQRHPQVGRSGGAAG